MMNTRYTRSAPGARTEKKSLGYRVWGECLSFALGWGDGAGRMEHARLMKDETAEEDLARQKRALAESRIIGWGIAFLFVLFCIGSIPFGYDVSDVRDALILIVGVPIGLLFAFGLVMLPFAIFGVILGLLR